MNLEVDKIEYIDGLDLNECTITLNNNIYKLETFCQSKKGKKTKCDPVIDVFSVFDALINIAHEPYISIIAFMDCQLAESNDDEKCGYSIVCGRACGDRVACISLRECPTLKSMMCIGIHEMLHTIGFDHCNSWKCIMNAIDCESWIFLSPVNLRKLKLFHSSHNTNRKKNSSTTTTSKRSNKRQKVEEKSLITTNTISEYSLVDRYQRMLAVLQSIDELEFNYECNWLKDKIMRIKVLDSSADRNVILDRNNK
jgi:hypothetical protein